MDILKADLNYNTCKRGGSSFYIIYCSFNSLFMFSMTVLCYPEDFVTRPLPQDQFPLAGLSEKFWMPVSSSARQKVTELALWIPQAWITSNLNALTAWKQYLFLSSQYPISISIWGKQSRINSKKAWVSGVYKVLVRVHYMFKSFRSYNCSMRRMETRGKRQ